MSKNDCVLTVRIDASSLLRLQQMAEDLDWTVSHLCRKIIKQHIAQKDRDQSDGSHVDQ